jgi:hypothetical protein
MAELHALRDRMLQMHNREGALFACLEAIQRDPQNHHVAVRDVGLFAVGSPDAGDTHEPATALFTVAAHQHPDDAEAWLLLAVNQMFWQENSTAARALAGMALTLEPGREDVRRIVNSYWSSPGGSGGADRRPDVLRRARAWAHAREAQQLRRGRAAGGAVGDRVAAGRAGVVRARSLPGRTGDRAAARRARRSDPALGPAAPPLGVGGRGADPSGPGGSARRAGDPAAVERRAG